MKTKQQEGNLDWVSSLRVLATISVIFLHVAANALLRAGEPYNEIWWTGNVYDGLVRWCVPVFVILTGALLLPKGADLKVFLKKRVVRIVIPFLFWSVVYIAFYLCLEFKHGHHLSLEEIIPWIGLKFWTGAAYHLWYVYMIIGLYLFIPILGRWIRNCSEQEILYFLLIWLVTIILHQPLRFLPKPALDLVYFTGYIGYAVLGYYLFTKEFENRKKILFLSSTMIVVGIMITIIGYRYLPDYGFYDYHSLNVALVAAGLFLLFKNSRATAPAFVNKTRDFINEYSYGIYLVHILVMSVLWQVGIHWLFINPWWAIPITTIVCLIGSVSLVYLIRKLPYGKYISG